MKKGILIICIIFIIIIGIYFVGKNYYISNTNKNEVNNKDNNKKNNEIIYSVEINSNKEKTSPNTLVIYKIYYTKCKHYITNYEEIDASLVNCNEDELRQKCKQWNIEEFSSEEVILSKEEEEYCNQHYKLKLDNNIIVIYNVKENGKEEIYEKTNISTEYLTEEDILKLNNGIIIYGKENLISSIEDYE